MAVGEKGKEPERTWRQTQHYKHTTPPTKPGIFKCDIKTEIVHDRNHERPSAVRTGKLKGSSADGRIFQSMNESSCRDASKNKKPEERRDLERQMGVGDLRGDGLGNRGPLEIDQKT